jgi:hypothetical protein
MRLIALRVFFGVFIAAQALLVIAQQREHTGTSSQQIIGGTNVTDEDRRALGLVTLNAGCSGVMLTDSWLLTAGHCFGTGGRPFAVTVSSVDKSAASNLVYVFGGELDVNGAPGSRGYDLALVHLAAPLAPANFAQKKILMSPPFLRGKNANFFGQGISSYFKLGPPPVPPAGSGTWRQATLTIQQQISHQLRHDTIDHLGWPDTLVSTSNAAGQVCAPGDSGGPVFFIDSATNMQWLAGIQVSGNFTCPNQSSVSMSACKATITNISACKANMIPLSVEEIIKTSWNPNSSVQVMDVGGELFNYMNDDPSGETLVDMNVRGWAITARAANEMCFNRGFVLGHMTGHQLNGKFGLVCSSRGAVWRDALKPDIVHSEAVFTNVNTDGWAQVRRAASNICAKEGKGFVGGHFNGHQRLGNAPLEDAGVQKAGLVCYAPPAKWFDATTAEIEATHWPVGDLNKVGWAQAARAATEFCKAKGYVAGFMTGHQVPANMEWCANLVTSPSPPTASFQIGWCPAWLTSFGSIQPDHGRNDASASCPKLWLSVTKTQAGTRPFAAFAKGEIRCCP